MKKKFWSGRNWIANSIVLKKERIKRLEEELEKEKENLPGAMEEAKAILVEKAEKELVGEKVLITQKGGSSKEVVVDDIQRVVHVLFKIVYKKPSGGSIAEEIDWETDIEIIEE